MIKRILVALDPDVDTQVATRYALHFAKEFKASLTGLAVVDSEQIAHSAGGGGIGTIYYAEQLRGYMEENSREEAGKLLSAFKNTVEKAGVKHSEMMEEGVPYERIIEDMKYHDLLIVGRDSHFFYNRPDKETNTLAQIVKNGNSPTLVVTESFRNVKRVVVAFDGSTAVARALQWFIHLDPYGKDLEIELVNVNSDESEYGKDESNLVLRLAEDYLKTHGFTRINKTVLEKGSPGEKLLEYQQGTAADLFLLGAHSMSAIRRMTFGSTTHYLVTHSKVPLFMCH